MRYTLLPTILIFSLACSSNVEQRPTDKDMKKLETALQEAAETWMQWDGVVGVAQGETDKGKPCIMVLVSDDTTASLKKLPKKFKGFEVKTFNTGNIDAY